MKKSGEKKKLGEILVERGIITEAQLAEALEEQASTGMFLGEVLINKGVADEEDVAKALGSQLGFAYVDLNEMDVEPQAMELVDENLCVRLNAIPLYILRDSLTLAMGNPLDVIGVDEFQTRSKLRIKPVFASYASIRKAIDKYYHPKRDRGTEAGGSVPGVTPGVAPPFLGPQAAGSPQRYTSSPSISSLSQNISMNMDQDVSLEEAANLAPVIETVDKLIAKAVEMGSSDIHLEPQKDQMNCRYRVDGILQTVSRIAAEQKSAVISRIKIMAHLDIAEKRLPQDGRMKMVSHGREVDLRVSTFPTVHGESIVMRILDRSSGVLTMEQLGFEGRTLEKMRRIIKRPYGIILVTGPTGSGKTSTLYAALSEIDSVEKNIITMEDPVEYEIQSIRQSQVNAKAGLTFASGLRSILRQDPDVIMIGEIRDKETADIAIHAALTGHLVFSTLHTNDSPSAAARLIDMGVEPFLVSSSLIGVLAQRLIRVLCDACKKRYSPRDKVLAELGIKIDDKETAFFFEEAGCAKCKKRGYLGRSGIYELLLPNEDFRSAVAQKQSATILRNIAIKHGMQTLREAGLAKAMSGLTSISEVLRVTDDG